MTNYRSLVTFLTTAGDAERDAYMLFIYIETYTSEELTGRVDELLRGAEICATINERKSNIPKDELLNSYIAIIEEHINAGHGK